MSTTTLRIMTAGRVAQELGITRNQVTRLAARGKIPCKGPIKTEHGYLGQLLFLASDVEQFKQKRKAS